MEAICCGCKRVCRSSKCSCVKKYESCFVGCPCSCDNKTEVPIARPFVPPELSPIPVIPQKRKRKVTTKKANKKQKLEEFEAIIKQKALTTKIGWSELTVHVPKDVKTAETNQQNPEASVTQQNSPKAPLVIENTKLRIEETQEMSHKEPTTSPQANPTNSSPDHSEEPSISLCISASEESSKMMIESEEKEKIEQNDPSAETSYSSDTTSSTDIPSDIENLINNQMNEEKASTSMKNKKENSSAQRSLAHSHTKEDHITTSKIEPISSTSTTEPFSLPQNLNVAIQANVAPTLPISTPETENTSPSISSFEIILSDSSIDVSLNKTENSAGNSTILCDTSEESSGLFVSSLREEKVKKKKKVSFGISKVRKFHRSVSLCSVPSTGVYPLGLGWKIVEELEMPTQIHSLPGLVYQVPEIDRITILRNAGIPIKKKSRVRRRNGDDKGDRESTTDEDDQQVPLHHIRTSRDRIGCNCHPGRRKKSKGKAKKKDEDWAPETCCTGSDCACAKEGLNCHIRTCFCADFGCGNPNGRRQLSVENVTMDRIRILQPELYSSIMKRKEEEKEKKEKEKSAKETPKESKSKGGGKKKKKKLPKANSAPVRSAVITPLTPEISLNNK